MTNIIRGRGGWTRYGMPDTTGIYYNYRDVNHVGQDGRFLHGTFIGPSESSGLNQVQFDQFGVNRGVRQIQKRINELGFSVHLDEKGIIDLQTDYMIGAAQNILGLKVDGEAGPITCKALFWPVIKEIAKGLAATATSDVVAHSVGGICQHESGFDPGAIGYSTPDDLGLVQINGPANPAINADMRFDFRAAYSYAVRRISNALATVGYTEETAICSYGYPAVAEEWVRTGFPPDTELGHIAQQYVDFVINWVAPS